MGFLGNLNYYNYAIENISFMGQKTNGKIREIGPKRLDKR